MDMFLKCHWCRPKPQIRHICLVLICVSGLAMLMIRSNISIIEMSRELCLKNIQSCLFPYPRRQGNCTTDFRNHHMMTVEYKGRTGNHLFRFASLLAVTELKCFKPVYNPTYTNIDDLFNLQNFEKFNEQGVFRIIAEPGFAIYDPNITSKVLPNFNWTLGGFRQSYRYFQNHSDLVRNSFRFKANIMKDVSAFILNDTIKERPTVCLHVRRGDFLTSSSLKGGRVPAGMDFINRSIAYITTYLKPTIFWLIVVTDDERWCRQNIKGDNIVMSPFKDEGRDLCLLTQCDHNIVTAGTFGWMGAWLNETGVVIYNKNFPIPNSSLARAFEVGDYYPGHWIGM